MAEVKRKRSDAVEDFMALAAEIDTENPDPEKVEQLQALIAINPGIVDMFGDLCHVALCDLVHGTGSDVAMKQIYYGAIGRRKKELGYDHSSVIERLAIDDVVLAYLRLYDVQIAHNRTMYNRSGLSHSAAEYMDRRLIYAQRRYMRALEGLARIRKLTKGIDVLQVNIAADGGQQVNMQNKSKKRVEKASRKNTPIANGE